MDYNVLKYMEKTIKYFKKICPTKVAFAEALARELKWMYWSKAEHELIISVENNRVFLIPWCGCREPDKVSIDVTDDTSFNWLDLMDRVIYKTRYNNRVKIDVWDQLKFRFGELIDYLWYTRLPYERKHPKFERE